MCLQSSAFIYLRSKHGLRHAFTLRAKPPLARTVCTGLTTNDNTSRQGRTSRATACTAQRAVLLLYSYLLQRR